MIRCSSSRTTLPRSIQVSVSPARAWAGILALVALPASKPLAAHDSGPLALPSSFALVFNADGGVLLQPDPANAATSSLTEAHVHISATNAADRSTIRLFGWTSKARLENGWL